MLHVYIIYFSRALISLVTVPVLVARLDDYWGLVAVALSTWQFSLVVVEFGFGISGVTAAMSVRDRPNLLGLLLKNTLLLQFFLALPCILFIISVSLTVHLSYVSIACLIAAVVLQGLTPIWMLKAMENLRAVAVAELAAKLLLFFFIYRTVSSPNDIDLLFVFYAASSLIPFTVALFASSKYCVFERGVVHAAFTLENIFKTSLPLLGVRVAGMTISVGGSLLFGIMGMVSLAGQYAILERVVTAARTIFLPVFEVLLPRLLALGYMSVSEVRLRKMVLYCMLCAGVVIGFILIFFRELIILYFNGSATLNECLLFLSFVPIVVILLNHVGLNHLVANNFGIKYFQALSLGAVMYICLLFIITDFPVNVLMHASVAYVTALAVSLFACLKLKSSYVQ